MNWRKIKASHILVVELILVLFAIVYTIIKYGFTKEWLFIFIALEGIGIFLYLYTRIIEKTLQFKEV